MDEQVYTDEAEEQVYTDTYAEPYYVTSETTVAEALAWVPGAEQIFEQHGCLTTLECTEDQHAEYVLGDLELVCHIDDSQALIDDLNAALSAAFAQADAVETAN